MHVLGFTGMPGAGKTEAIEVARARRLPIVTMGDFVREETRRRGLDLTDANVGRVASEVRAAHGAEHWARLTADAVDRLHATAPLVIIDGVRTHEEVETFRKRMGSRFELVAITAPPEYRLDRLRRRARSDAPTHMDDLKRRDERELGWGIAKSIALADRVIVNEGDLPTFRREVEAFLDRVAQDHPRGGSP